MGDISAEPSMEEILSSIKRIIAEEGDGLPGRRRPARAAAPAARAPDYEPESERAPEPVPEEQDEVLELSDPMPSFADPRLEPPAAEPVRPIQQPAAPQSAFPQPAAPDPILSPAAADATRGALDSLSRVIVTPEPGGDGTLEGLVREMLRPMLREWLDAHLPEMVERMVAREIARISGK